MVTVKNLLRGSIKNIFFGRGKNSSGKTALRKRKGTNKKNTQGNPPDNKTRNPNQKSNRKIKRKKNWLSASARDYGDPIYLLAAV